VPIYEPGLESLVVQNRSAGRLAFSTDLATTLRAAEVLFICVGTPPLVGGQVDLSQVESVARSVGLALEDGYKVVVNKSTVPVGSGDWVSLLIREGIEERRVERCSTAVGRPSGDTAELVADRPLPHFDVVSN